MLFFTHIKLVAHLLECMCNCTHQMEKAEIHFAKNMVSVANALARNYELRPFCPNWEDLEGTERRFENLELMKK